MQFLPIPPLTAANRRALAAADSGSADLENRRRYASSIGQERERSVPRWYREGGYWFIQWVKRWYKTHTGQDLKWTEPFQPEFYLLMGTPNVETVVVEKGAQMGFSECLIALAGFVLAAARTSCGLGFEAERKLRDMVPRIQTTFDYVEPIQATKRQRRGATGRKDVDFKERMLTVGGVPLTFFYTSTSTSNKQERQASSAMSSFTAWVMLADEIELWPEGTLDIATERQSACEMATKPLRAGSTPGQEGGIIDAMVQRAKHLFQWQVRCPHCGEAQFLDPFGNLLIGRQIANDDGTAELQYVDALGKPHDWHCRDRSSREAMIATAYVGCSQCGEPLGWEAIAAGQFTCRHTGVGLTALVQDLVRRNGVLRQTVALRLPRLASTLFDPVERIQKLLETRNPADQLQQGLGKACTVGTGKISLVRLQRCVGLPLPDWCQGDRPHLTTLGVDQGGASNLAMVVQWWFPVETRRNVEQAWRQAHCRVVWWGEVLGFSGIRDKAREWGADLIGLDMEPEKQLAAEMARISPPLALDLRRDRCDCADRTETGMVCTLGDNLRSRGGGSVFLFDQVVLKGEEFRRSTRTIQGSDVPMFALHRTFGLDAVRDRIYRGQVHFPEGITYDARDSHNLLAHYMASDRTLDGQWVQQPGVPDHFHHAHNFAEMAVLAALYEPRPKRLVFTSIRR